MVGQVDSTVGYRGGAEEGEEGEEDRVRGGIWGWGLPDEEEEGEVGCEVEGVLGVGGGHSVAFSYGFWRGGEGGGGLG